MQTIKTNDSEAQRTMSSQEHINKAAWCPVCRCLPLDPISSTLEPLEYHISDNATNDESDREGLRKYDRCALYFVVMALRRMWSGREALRSSAPSCIGDTGARLENTCAGDVKVHGDSNSQMGKEPESGHSLT